MMMNKKISICLIFFAALATISLTAVKMQSDDSLKEVGSVNTNGSDVNTGMTSIPKNYIVDSTFSSHLPIVVIDTQNQDIPVAVKYDVAAGYYKKIDGVDPSITARMSVYDNDGINTVSDTASCESAIQIRYRGNSSIEFDKKQYKIRLVNEDGTERESNIMGLGSDDEWILNISMADPSLLRNYVALTMAGEIDESTPDVRYCEVLMKKGSAYEYEGLYLMMECVKRSENRIDIKKYKPKNVYSSYILRRDRYNEDGVMLDTFAERKDISKGCFEVKYPIQDDITQNTVNYIQNDINRIEELLYNGDTPDMAQLGQYLDIDSFVDYFLINELMGNYDAGMYSTYMYKDFGGKLHMGPVWDFDLAMDNHPREMQNVQKIVFPYQPWFDRLCLSEEFDQKLLSRYRQLRKTTFSDEEIEDMIENTAAELGNASKRDWSRWGAEYTKAELGTYKDANGISIDRNRDSFEGEEERLEDNLITHAYNIEPQLEKLKDDNTTEDMPWGKYGMQAVAFIVLFLAVIVMTRRRSDIE